jgi:hypothetical protein
VISDHGSGGSFGIDIDPGRAPSCCSVLLDRCKMKISNNTTFYLNLSFSSVLSKASLQLMVVSKWQNATLIITPTVPTKDLILGMTLDAGMYSAGLLSASVSTGSP